VEVLSSCEEGICGTCETKVLEGMPEHRDSVLDGAQRSSGATMMICCSRATSETLVLDL
jgi:ferredoxin